MSILSRILPSLKTGEEISPSLNRHMAEVECWKSVYAGDGTWRYGRKGGLDGGLRRINRLPAAKALTGELASLCFSQQVEFDTSTESERTFLLDTLQKNDFWTAFPLFLEEMFALGGGVVKCRTDEDGAVHLDFIGADAFIPLQYDDKSVYGGVIISRTEKDGAAYILLERHERTDSGSYLITNTLYRDKNGSVKKIPLCELYPGLSEETEVSGLSAPLFTYFRPSSYNNREFNPLGISVYANSLDILKELDTVFDSLEREFILGKKRIIVPVSAIRGEYVDGELKKYFDASDEVYQAFSADDREELKITDNTTALRVPEHKEALEMLLNILCMASGLSEGTLSYTGTARTATEVISRNSKTYRTKTAHQQLIREGLIAVAENILLLGGLTGKLSGGSGKVGVSFADGVMLDNTAKLDNTLKLYGAGLIDRDKALSEIYGGE